MNSSIGKQCVAVTPSNTNYITSGGNQVEGSLYIGVAGDIVVLPWYHADTNTATPADGGAVLFKNVPVGFFPICVKKVFSTGTNATDIVCIFN